MDQFKTVFENNCPIVPLETKNHLKVWEKIRRQTFNRY